MTKSSCRTRADMLQGLQQVSLDLLVIGGGITGAGISLDATNRGMRTGLVDMQDFAAGTSSRSTKLVHGGLRYLKQLEVGLVAEVGKERAIVFENAPHVTTPEWMMLPFYKGGTFGPFSTNIGLRVYDFLAGVKKEERRKMLKPEGALQKEPLLQSNGLKGAGYYVEYKTDDARLTLEIVKKSVELGTYAANYVKVTGLLYDQHGNINGASAKDQMTGESFQIYAKKIINAAGPWVDHLREMDGSKEGKTLQLTKGVHLVFSQTDFPLQQAIYFDSPDQRMIFAIPRGEKTYVGTTDSIYDGDIAHPIVNEEDRNYLLAAINEMFPSLTLTPDEIESSWAGVRPLISEAGKSPSEISRKDEIFLSDSGLYSMAGGKLTGYRKMAKSVVDKIAADFKKEENLLFDPSSTKHLPLSGGDVGGSAGFEHFKKKQITQAEKVGIRREEALRLIDHYGSNVAIVFEKYRESCKNKAGVDPIVLAQLKYAIEEEYVCTPVDFFMRRTGAVFFNIGWVEKHQGEVLLYMARLFHWSEGEMETYRAELQTVIHEAKLNNIKG